VFLTLALLTPHRAVADPCDSFGTCTNYGLPNSTYTYKVNPASSNITWNESNFTFSGNQLLWWVNYALATWKERTGANLTFNYAGTTTTGCGGLGDSTSTVAFQAGCNPFDNPPCSTLGCEAPTCNQELPACSAAGTVCEADVCIFGGASPNGYSVEDNMPAGALDLVGLVTHELGHAMGLGHEANTVMRQFDSPGSTRERYPFGDDITNLVTNSDGAYGFRSLKVYWSEYVKGSSGTGWTTGVSLPSSEVTAFPPAAAIGLSGTNTGRVVIGVIARSDQQIVLERADYPLSAASTWTQKYPQAVACGSIDGKCKSWRPPGIAARSTGTPLWVAAWTSRQATWQAGTYKGIRVLYSTDGFDSWTFFTDSQTGLGSALTIQQPALVYDSYAGRFVLVYVLQADVSGSSVTDNTLFVTTWDGNPAHNWTTPVSTGEMSIDAPSMACPPYGANCLMALARGTSWTSGSTLLYDPTWVTRVFTVAASDGAFAFGSTSLNTAQIQRTPMATKSTMFGDLYWSAAQDSTDANQRSNGTGVVKTRQDYAIPQTSSPVSSGITTDHPAVVVSSPMQERTYLIYVNP